ncbi:MAG: hypothetical protein ACO1NU_16555 [Arcticibacter sp.]
MSSIPIIFVHRGDAPYLKHVFAHTHAFNNDSNIFLLGDEANSGHAYVNHIRMDDYAERAKEFEKVYKHMSSNSYDFELFCFQRWFIINDFVQTHDIENFLCLDSDALLFCGVDKTFENFKQYDFTISQGHSPHFTLFSRSSLDRFCNYLTELYTKPEYIERSLRNFRVFQEEKRQGGICDMFAFSFYTDDISNNVRELSQLSEDMYFDSNINEADGFECDRNRKRIYWKNNLPYGRISDTGEYVRFYGLHFQGAAKSSIQKYILNKNLRRPGFTSSLKRLLGSNGSSK